MSVLSPSLRPPTQVRPSWWQAGLAWLSKLVVSYLNLPVYSFPNHAFAPAFPSLAHAFPSAWINLSYPAPHSHMLSLTLSPTSCPCGPSGVSSGATSSRMPSLTPTVWWNHPFLFSHHLSAFPLFLQPHHFLHSSSVHEPVFPTRFRALCIQQLCLFLFEPWHMVGALFVR